ncbi:MAG: hypothetical protein PVH61_30825 [Candidatus Aminicenantes bacterium]
MNDLKKAIKENFLKIDLGVFDNGDFDPSCWFSCTTECMIGCAIGCPISNAPGPVNPDPT